MKMKFLSLILIAFMVSCKSQKTNTSKSEPLASGDYQVVNLDGENISEEGVSLHIDLEKNTISGFSGCNNFSAELKTDENSIETGGAIATLKHCEGKMDIERSFLDNLENATAYHLENEELSLLDKKGKTLIKATLMQSKLRNGTYKVLTVGGESADDKEATFEINTEQNRISGTTGCNTFGNEFEVNGDKIEMSLARVTKMYCEGKMEFERDFLKNFSRAEAFGYKKDVLELKSAEGNILISAELVK